MITIIISILMMLSSLWIGTYFYKYAKDTWADMPYVLTCIGIWFVGFFMFIIKCGKM